MPTNLQLPHVISILRKRSGVTLTLLTAHDILREVTLCNNSIYITVCGLGQVHNVQKRDAKLLYIALGHVCKEQ